MNAKRIIPLFLLKGQRLVKGVQFENFVDVGDPLSQAMIYDAQGADEIVIVDIEASRQNRLIDGNLINALIRRTRLPIAVGGGIKTVEDGRKCFRAGADKIVINTHAVLNEELVSSLAEEFGRQAVVVSVDVRRDASGKFVPHIFSGAQRSEKPLEEALGDFVEQGAGEIILTVIDREGTLSGYEDSLYSSIRPSIPVPLIASGGAGCYDDMARLFHTVDVDGCTLGTMLTLRDYDIVRIKAYLTGEKIPVRDA